MKRNILLLVTSLFITLFIIEVVLRFNGKLPGNLHSGQWVKNVDTLVSIRGYTTGADGIHKVDTSIRHIYNYPKGVTDIFQYQFYIFDLGYAGTLPALISDIYESHHGEIDNNYTNYVRKIKNQTVFSELDSSILIYDKQPINDEGFYSLPFKQFPNRNKKSVLLLGDSFTWGHSTDNKTSSFANELLAKGYVVYNSGISGVDPAQYLEIAKKYIPILKPDHVIVNFFLGNDVFYFKRHPKPFQPVFFTTNAQNIMANYRCFEFTTKEEAYANFNLKNTIPKNSVFNKIAASTTITTKIWSVLGKCDLIKEPILWDDCQDAEYPFANEEMEELRVLCKKYGSEFDLVVIPDTDSRSDEPSDFRNLFVDQDYLLSPVKRDGYKTSDSHFNDLGHYQYSQFLDSVISAN